MAGEGGAEEETTTEYESDPEEAKLSLKMRRREASDDEEEEQEDEDEVVGGGGEVEERESREVPAIGAVDSEGESDGQGAAADYDDEEEDEEEEEYYDEEYEEYEEVEEREGVVEEVEKAEEGGGAATAKVKEGEEGEEKGEVEEGGGEGEGEGEREEKKEAEPFAVPTSGAFYMHDDRFRDNAAGRHRRTFGGRKLWESKDEKKWGHDKFEELTQDRHYDEGRRNSKGYYRGRGRARGASNGNPRGGRGRGYNGNSSQSAAPKDVRGRGPRRYQASMRNKNDFHSPHYKQSARSLDQNSHSGPGRKAAPAASSNVEHESAPAKKAGSNLSSASPPFYPSGASNKDPALPQKKEVLPGNNNRNMRPSTMDQHFPVPISNPSVRGKNVIDGTGMDKLRIDGSVSSAGAKPSNMHLRSSGSSLSPNQLAHPRGQGRGLTPTGSPVFQPPQANHQVNKVSPQAAQANQRYPAQTQGLSPLQSSGQQLVQRSVGTLQSSSPPKAEKLAVQGNGKGVYGGAQVVGSGGNAGAGRGDPNMPAFFPVMQFGGQHPGGIPAVGMAFPGYVAQPNGLGNSEMTWLPVLASAAGAMGATYCPPPYLSVDGNYNPRPTGQASALPAPSKDDILSKPSSEVKAHQRSEVANDEFNQRQNKPRRYSEMSFSQ